MLMSVSFTRLLSVSHNQPRLCPTTTWNQNATTFANSTTIGNGSIGIFIDYKNSIYVAAQTLGRVDMWPRGSSISTPAISSNLSFPASVFVTFDGDVYIDNGLNGQVEKWSVNGTSNVTVMYTNGGWCSGLFIDINRQLYCSIRDQHQVIKSSLNGDANVSTVVAGTGLNGSTSGMLHAPHGIFVDLTLSLYVADCGNDRVQLFRAGRLNATTMVGNGTTSIILSCPTGVVLDGDGYLFIVDSGNNRIIGSGPSGFRCVAGCTGVCSSATDHLCNPISMAFDPYGKMYVTDDKNNRIQVFTPTTNSCGEYEFCSLSKK
jgi:hypothetical protein